MSLNKGHLVGGEAGNFDIKAWPDRSSACEASCSAGFIVILSSTWSTPILLGLQDAQQPVGAYFACPFRSISGNIYVGHTV